MVLKNVKSELGSSLKQIEKYCADNGISLLRIHYLDIIKSEKLILSFKLLAIDIDITSCKSQKVIKDIIL